ncbi:hypothetical protein D4Q52_05440 [Rhodopseudomonas palustris]|uniref:Uncharacterized protein n=1 Tax=Rhodopseudomonas palustris TaxID=1076 RepID=A0A418VKC3_RHOPL|nr:hypothetical protein D4Q52_05440 [Rhodopseudomonas palustris]
MLASGFSWDASDAADDLFQIHDVSDHSAIAHRGDRRLPQKAIPSRLLTACNRGGGVGGCGA